MIEITPPETLRKFIVGVRHNAVHCDTVEIHGNEIHYRCVAESGRIDYEAEEAILYEFLLVQCLDSGTVLGVYVFLCRGQTRIGTLITKDGQQVGEWSADINYFLDGLYSAAMLAGRSAQAAYPPVGPNELGKYFESHDSVTDETTEDTTEQVYAPQLSAFKETATVEVLESTPDIEIQRVYNN